MELDQRVTTAIAETIGDNLGNKLTLALANGLLTVIGQRVAALSPTPEVEPPPPSHPADTNE